MKRKKRKLTAKQKRERKERERRERKAYQEGKTPAAEPRRTSDRRKKREERRQEQKEEWREQHPSWEDMKDAGWHDFKNKVWSLLEQGLDKYMKLTGAGIQNTATAIWESEFADKFGQIDFMDLNTLKALFKELSRWLKRKDTNFKRARKNFEKAKKKFGFEDADEAKEFWDLFKKWLESSDKARGTPGSPKQIQAFKDSYQKWRASGSDNMQDLFDMADKALEDLYEPIDPFDFPGEDDDI